MESALRAALLAWLAADANLTEQLNSLAEEAPSRVSLPWLAIAASASADWSTKTRIGREIRVAFELHCRGDQPDAGADLASAIENRIASFPREQPDFSVITAQFLRSRVEQRGESERAILIEYRFRVLST
ncbi:MAG: DUF3168 domain-containing protein [Novosphingobium sp.]|nr:DUF3168 domain-containing protein [Novosphingobium sp.]